MKEDLFLPTLEEDIRRSGERPLEELYRELKEQGIMDDQGRIIVRMPEPPNGVRRDTKVRKRKRPRKTDR